MEENKIPKRASNNIAEGRRIGRPRLRLEDYVRRNIQKLRVTYWWMVTRNRDTQQMILKEAEIRSGLWRY